MTGTKKKKRLMYTVFAFIFLFGGIEYAVILPTIWLYLHNTYNAPEYMLGLILSAYSVSVFFCSPIFGRISDKFGHTKQIFIVCATFELAGSFLYFVGISQWLCLASRFVSGLGGASEAIALAEVARYTSEKERTSIMSKLVATRQIALLMAPGLNLFLRIADFDIGPFHVDKYTAPGAFMCLMWIILIIIVLCFYNEPKIIYAEEKAAQMAAADAENEQQASIYDSYASDVNACQQFLPEKTNIPSDEENRQTQCNSVTESFTSSEDSVLPPSAQTKQNDVEDSQESIVPIPTDFLGTSFDIMVSAEKYMTAAHEAEDSHTHEDEELYFDNHHYDHHDDSCYRHITKDSTGRLPHHSVSETTGLLSGIDGYSNTSPSRSRGQIQASQSYSLRTSSALESPIAKEGKLGFFCNEYIRDEIIALVAILFCSMFTQICVETMLTPITLKYMDFGELENSIWYCFSGVEIIAVFILVSWLSKRVSDRNMILFGATVLLATNAWMFYFLPIAPPHNRSHNLPFFVVALITDVLSLPFLLVCATSLYSKLTRRETQGLSQGLRRGVVGIGTILGPLWGSSTVAQPRLLMGVIGGVQLLTLMLCILSYKRLKPLQQMNSVDESIERSRSAVQSRNQHRVRHEADSLLNHATSSSYDGLPSAQYGSIQSELYASIRE